MKAMTSGSPSVWKAMLRAGAGLLAVAFALGAAAREAAAEPIAYAIGTLSTAAGALFEQGWFCRIDLGTGEMTPIARVVDPDNPPNFLTLAEALDFDAAGRLQVVTGGERLFELSRVTGQAIGPIKILTDVDTGITLNKAGYGLALSATGPQYISAGLSGRFFGTVDLATGMVDQILAGTPAAAANAIAVNAAGAVYAGIVTTPIDVLRLASINPVNGAFTIIGTIADPMNRNVGLDFDENGQLWGIDEGVGSVNGTVWRVDLATGARFGVLTPTDPVTGMQFRSEMLAILTPSPVPALPELAVALLVLAIVGVAAAQSRRRVRVTRR